MAVATANRASQFAQGMERPVSTGVNGEEFLSKTMVSCQSFTAESGLGEIQAFHIMGITAI